MSLQSQIFDLTNRLIEEGEIVRTTQWQPRGNYLHGAPTFVDLLKFRKWRASCSLLASLMGELALPWRDILTANYENSNEAALTTSGTLEAIREAIDHELLVRSEDIVFAEAFSDLIGQAEYLFEQGYILASGVILRSVLEERLKLLCDRNNCVPTKQRPTIVDYNAELYRQKVYDIITMKHVESMAAVGNDAAHNNPQLSKDDVGRFLRDLLDFLQKFSK